MNPDVKSQWVAALRSVDANTGILPTEVMEWAGLEYLNPVVEIPDSEGKKALLGELNDNPHWDFVQIADVIDVQR